jgi:hypothetical protein
MYISFIYHVYTGQDVIYQLYTRNIDGIYHIAYVYTYFIAMIYNTCTEYMHVIY